MTDTIYGRFALSLDLKRTRVYAPDSIFLCGGAISDDPNTFASCRDYFLNHVNSADEQLSKRIVLAEKVIEYFEQSEYTDLLTFERDLAELSSMTVVFVESAGSIAELGSFSVLEEINSRLMVVLHSQHTDKKSFILNGPIKFLENEVRPASGKTAVHIYDWNEATGDFPDAVDLVEALHEISVGAHQTERFSATKSGHVMLLIQELVNLQRISTIGDIEEQLSKLDISQKKSTLQRWLSLLVSLDYMAKTPYGHNIFYIATDQPRRVSLAFSSDAEANDPVRWQAIFLKHYEEHEERKFRALQAHHRRIGSEDEENE